MPLELLPSEVRSKYQAKPADKSKRAKKEEMKTSVQQAEENQVSISTIDFQFSILIWNYISVGMRIS